MSYVPATPTQGGYLPYFLLLGSTAAIYNVIQSHITQWQTKELYQRKEAQITPLAARIFGVYTLMAAVIRGVTAYNITNPPVYLLGIAAHVIAFSHFTLEMVVFGSVKLNRATFWPFLISITGTVWMISQKEYYTGA